MATTAYMIKQFGVLSVAKFFGVIGLVWGFFMGIFLAIGVGGMATAVGTQMLGVGAGLIGWVMMIIIGGIGGFISGAIVAIVYNIVLGAIGGIEMDLEVKS
ncbi:hypothetical protein [Methanoregula sp.]|jgi:hypothetical protein|uniref:hypothetical protein n=1 Tax=Methanoregula sp. TaxID=2052170 RepID=UPI003C29042B